MKVEIIPCLQDNYSYLIIDEDKLEACVVDPSEAKPIIDYWCRFARVNNTSSLIFLINN